VVDVAPRDRHLLLLVRQGAEKSKFVCGHDERHWFVAAVPEVGGVSGVATAKAALQPAEVRRVVARKRPQDAFRRRNSAYVRQGEWFVVPEPTFRVPESLVLRNEPLMRSGGTPHRMRLVRDPEVFARSGIRITRRSGSRAGTAS
jgi:hypothetical protein